MKVTCITGNYPDGQKICSAEIEYPAPIDAFSINPDCFEVAGRHISGCSVSGSSVILDLDLRDEAAPLIPQPKRMGPPPGGKKPEGPPRSPMAGMPPAVRRAPELKVRQKEAFRFADGGEAPAWEDFLSSSESLEPVVEQFRQLEYKGINYNLFVPENPKGEKLPLVFFLHDAGPCGDDPKLPLSQGNGAITWAKPEWQAKHPCYVLAPGIKRSVHLTRDDFSFADEFYILKEIIDLACDSCDVDKDRVYLTGQSMGCMSSCEMNIQWPDCFAASMLVAGQWSPERMAKSCTKSKLWILVSRNDAKAFPGMNAVTAALEEKGVKVGRYLWNAKAGAAELNALAAEAAADDVQLRYTVFQGSSVVPDGRDDGPGANHVCTWPVAYELEGVKEWLFAQRR
jgi:predicted peptidase